MTQPWAKKKTLHVLLVEDSPLQAKMVELATAALPSLNIVHVAKDGVEAIEFLAKVQSSEDMRLPDVVLCDINMPKMNGFEVLAHIRQEQTLNHLPVVMLTTSDQEQDIAKAYEEGASTFITKPIDILALEQILKHFVNYWEAATPPEGISEKPLAATPGRVGSSHGGPAGVLIVEDSPTQAAMLERFVDDVRDFERLGSLRNGRDALDFLSRSEPYQDAPRPDVILLDLNLPELDGFELLDHVSRTPEWKSIVIIVLTERDSLQDRIECYRKGANTYLVKPSTAQELGPSCIDSSPIGGIPQPVCHRRQHHQNEGNTCGAVGPDELPHPFGL